MLGRQIAPGDGVRVCGSADVHGLVFAFAEAEHPKEAGVGRGKEGQGQAVAQLPASLHPGHSQLPTQVLLRSYELDQADCAVLVQIGRQ